MEAATRPSAGRTDPVAGRTDPVRRGGRVRRLTTEIKQAFKTTEFWAISASS
jgi:hypothetical protein